MAIIYAIKMLVGIATIFVFRQFYRDVTQAYIQILEALNLDVIINPPKKFELRPSNYFTLHKTMWFRQT